MTTWEERMSAKHRHVPTEIPWREPTLRERFTRHDLGWFRWLPRPICTRCYEWRRDGPIRLMWFRVCGEGSKLCEHRHHKYEVWLAFVEPRAPDWVYGGTYRIHGADDGVEFDSGWTPYNELP